MRAGERWTPHETGMPQGVNPLKDPTGAHKGDNVFMSPKLCAGPIDQTIKVMSPVILAEAPILSSANFSENPHGPTGDPQGGAATQQGGRPPQPRGDLPKHGSRRNVDFPQFLGEVSNAQREKLCPHGKQRFVDFQHLQSILANCLQEA